MTEPDTTMPTADSASSLQVEYGGRHENLLQLALVASILTVLTLGFYRFWMKSRLRRYYWSAIRPGGYPLEYLGTGLEKLLGFFIAVIFLAFYIGIFNLALMFFSFSVFDGNAIASVSSFFVVIPLVFYAQYRARRYILARTRWRGLRFGVDKGAWGFVVRSFWYWFLTIVSLGLLLPLKTFKLEKYKVDRSWYGNARMTQEGRWTMLFRAAMHLYIGVALAALSTVALVIGEDPTLISGIVLGSVWAGVGYLYFQVNSFRILANNKHIDGGIGFVATPRTGKILKIYFLGGMAVGFLTSFIASSIAGVAGIIFARIALGEYNAGDQGAVIDKLAEGNALLAVAAFLGVYLTFFVTASALSQIFITQPLVRHYAETTTLTNPAGLDKIRQRDRDEFAEAEGFADALDVGAAI